MDLSVLIPARNEEFLGRTIQDVLENSEANTEVIVILDGYLPNPPLTQLDKRVTLIYNPISKGQRAATNQAAKIAKGKYLMKLDAHCALDKGFDVKMLQAFKETGDNVTMIPLMRNLHAFDWVCPNNHRWYQGKKDICDICGKIGVKDIHWTVKPSPGRFTFTFDRTMHFQYDGAEAKKPENTIGTCIGYELSFDTNLISSEIISLLTDLTNSHQLTCFTNSYWFWKNVSSNAMDFSSINDARRVRIKEIFSVRNQSQMQGITTPSISTNMVNNQDILSSSSWDSVNQPSVNESVCKCFFSEIGTSTISSIINSSDPVPASGSIINSDVIEKFNEILGGQFIYNEKTKSFHNGSIALLPIFDNMLRRTLSIQGSCFMLTKEKYFELDICSETDFHSWGQQGVEVACKTWLSGGRVIANLRTWYAHMFRTNNFGGFPYSNPQSLVNENRERSRELFQRDKWPQAIHTFQWLLDKFNPPEWGSTKGIIYYTDHETEESIVKLVQSQLVKINQEKRIPIVTSSLKRKVDFGVKNIFFPSLKIRGVLSQAKQILGALENSTADIIFFCEADVLYHPSHFDFKPEKYDAYYYNVNVWKVRWSDGHALKVDDLKQLSGLCGYREHLIQHYKKKIEIILQRQKDILALGQELHNEGVSKYMGYEPGMHSEPRGVDNFPVESWNSEFPNIDIRHNNNLTKNRWTKEEFQDQQYTKGWIETTADKIPGWENHFRDATKMVTKGMIYYTDNQLTEAIAKPVRSQLIYISEAKDVPIVTSALKRRLNFGVKNIFFPSLKRSYYALFKQVLGALENSKSDIIFFTEHDVLYHPSHFDFKPLDKETFYYNQNVWYIRPDGFALHYDVSQLSGLCVYRETAIIHFRERLERIEKEGFSRNMGFEPFTHGRVKWNNTFKLGVWKSPYPNIDIRFGINSTGMRWRKDQYRNQQLLINWTESTIDKIPGWDNVSDLIKILS